MIQTANIKIIDIYRKTFTSSHFFHPLWYLWLIFQWLYSKYASSIELKHRKYKSNFIYLFILSISDFSERFCGGFWIVHKFNAFLLF